MNSNSDTRNQDVTLSVHQGVATICWNRPDAMNALTPDMLQMAGDMVTSLAERDDIRVVVLTGAGKAFSAGVDLKALGKVEIDGGCVGEVLDRPARRLIAAIEDMPQPVIAKVNGHCYTGALEIALACDLLICATQAGLGDTHAKWGLRPTWGMSQRLPARIGLQRAKEMSLTARTIKGDEAAQIGLALRAVPLEDLDSAADEMCASILKNSPDALAAYKNLYRQTSGLALSKGLEFEAQTRYEITDSMDRLGGFLKG